MNIYATISIANRQGRNISIARTVIDSTIAGGGGIRLPLDCHLEPGCEINLTIDIRDTVVSAEE